MPFRSIYESLDLLTLQLDRASVIEIIDLFVENSQKQLTVMRQARLQNDAETIVRLAHMLKSSSANLGARAFSARCMEVEHTALHEATDIDGALWDLESLLKEAIAIMMAWRNRSGS